jgi:poly(A) polymerase
MSLKQTSLITPKLHEDWIDSDALDIVYQLQHRGYTTYLVGGCVRDLLIGREPKDFDISTIAKPKDVKYAIRNSYIIGKRFRLVLAKRDDRLFEVSTFRRDPKPEELASEDQPTLDNIFGTPEEDAKRRDFTINALFYDPFKKKVIDHVGGLPDLKDGIVRMIGNPIKRLDEDPIRILRGIRLSHMIRFSLEEDLKRGMKQLAHRLPSTALPRRREEILKFLRLDDPALPFLTANDLGVLKHLSPMLHDLLNDSRQSEEFLTQMHEFSALDLSTPEELFTGLAIIFSKTKLESGLYQLDKVEKFLTQESTLEFLRNELGLFNAELANLKKTIQIIGHLQRRSDFERRGERRRWALFRNESFSLSLKLAEKLYLLSPKDLAFWKSEYDKRPDDLQTKNNSTRPRRRRRKAHKKITPASN